MNCLRRGRSLSMALCLFVVCPACVATTTRFVQSDKSFRARAGTAAPRVFIDGEPGIAFASVGILEVEGPVTEPGETFIKAAVSEGTKLGCDLLVHEALYEMRQGGRFGRPNGVAAWLFTCGVFDPSKPTEETARLADATAEKIVRVEFGQPICATQALTGSHISKTVCRLPGAYRIWDGGKPWHWNVP